MKQIHLTNCDSTQNILKTKIEHGEILKSDPTLISCDVQTAGVGRSGNSWDCYENTLCLSLNVPPCEVLTLTPIEMGLIVSDFFKEEFDTVIKTKWPNDLMSPDGKKVGGIICNFMDNDSVIVGIGINLLPGSSDKTKTYPHSMGYCLNSSFESSLGSKAELSYKIALYIQEHRIQANKIPDLWSSKCIHIDKEVRLKDDQDNIGKFIGISPIGEAMIETASGISNFVSGNLFIL